MQIYTGEGQIGVQFNTVGYSRKTTSKDLQVDQCKRDFSTLSTLSAYRAINSCKTSGYWKGIFLYNPLFVLYF